MTPPRLFPLTGLIAVASLLVACSKHPDAPVSTEQPAVQTATTESAPPHPVTVCDVLTAAEMSNLLGSSVTAKTQRLASACTYPSVADFGPNAELKIERGDGEAAMKGAAFANQFEPGSADPLAGLSDQAISAGPMIMIRRGDDLISIRVSGVEDSLAAVKRIYAAVNAKMTR